MGLLPLREHWSGAALYRGLRSFVTAALPVPATGLVPAATGPTRDGAGSPARSKHSTRVKSPNVGVRSSTPGTRALPPGAAPIPQVGRRQLGKIGLACSVAAEQVPRGIEKGQRVPLGPASPGNGRGKPGNIAPPSGPGCKNWRCTAFEAIQRRYQEDPRRRFLPSHYGAARIHSGPGENGRLAENGSRFLWENVNPGEPGWSKGSNVAAAPPLLDSGLRRNDGGCTRGRGLAPTSVGEGPSEAPGAG